MTDLHKQDETELHGANRIDEYRRRLLAGGATIAGLAVISVVGLVGTLLLAKGIRGFMVGYSLILWAIYDDRMVRTPDVWKISHHRLERLIPSRLIAAPAPSRARLPVLVLIVPPPAASPVSPACPTPIPSTTRGRSPS